jgi:DNA-binding MarR family transcriptional regulator
MSNIQNTYYDALFFASSTNNEKETYFLRPVEFKLLIKLIHYSTKDEVITWSSENIHQHTCIPIGSVDKAIQRIKQKGYITVVNKQITKTYVKREITINWKLIETIDSLYNDWVDGKTVKAIENVKEVASPTIEEKVIEEITVITQPTNEEQLNGVAMATPYEIEDDNSSFLTDNLLKGYNVSKYQRDYLLKQIKKIEITPENTLRVWTEFINTFQIEDKLANFI